MLINCEPTLDGGTQEASKSWLKAYHRSSSQTNYSQSLLPNTEHKHTEYHLAAMQARSHDYPSPLETAATSPNDTSRL
jgi:hypothetical protein